MIDTRDYLKRVEDSLLASRVINVQLCEEFKELSPENQVAFANAIAFAGCKTITNSLSDAASAVSEADRIHASRFLLLRLYTDTANPRWSSWVLEKMWEAVMNVPGSNVTDLFKASLELLAAFACPLTETLANFSKEVVINAFTKYRAAYQAADFGWIEEKANHGLSSAQAYLTMYAIPPRYMTAQVRVAILKALAETEYWAIALAHFEDELGDTETRQLLSSWLSEGASSAIEGDLHRILSSSA